MLIQNLQGCVCEAKIIKIDCIIDTHKYLSSGRLSKIPSSSLFMRLLFINLKRNIKVYIYMVKNDENIKNN